MSWRLQPGPQVQKGTLEKEQRAQFLEKVVRPNATSFWRRWFHWACLHNCYVLRHPTLYHGFHWLLCALSEPPRRGIPASHLICKVGKDTEPWANRSPEGLGHKVPNLFVLQPVRIFWGGKIGLLNQVLSPLYMTHVLYTHVCTHTACPKSWALLEGNCGLVPNCLFDSRI